MPMSFLAAKQAVARVVGGSSVTAQLTIAGEMVQEAIRELDSRANWEFTRKTLADITVVANTDTYALTSAGSEPPVKKIYSARLKINKRALYFIRQRGIDRMLRDQEQSQIPLAYDEVVTPTGISIKLFPIPSVGETLQVRVYQHIDDTYADGDNLGVPERFLPMIVSMARGYLLLDRDSEDQRGHTYITKAENQIEKAMLSDANTPDEDIRIIPTDEWAGAYGSDPIDDLGLSDDF